MPNLIKNITQYLSNTIVSIYIINMFVNICTDYKKKNIHLLDTCSTLVPLGITLLSNLELINGNKGE